MLILVCVERKMFSEKYAIVFFQLIVAKVWFISIFPFPSFSLYMKVESWWGILLAKVTPLLYNNGGPIIMVQVIIYAFLNCISYEVMKKLSAQKTLIIKFQFGICWPPLIMLLEGFLVSTLLTFAIVKV